MRLKAGEIYQKPVHGNWGRTQFAPGGRWQTFEVLIELNLATSEKQPDRWQAMKLLYVRGVNLDTDTASSKRD